MAREQRIDQSACVFRREGDYWTVIYDGTLCRVRATRGMQHLAYLLRRPCERVAAVDLHGPTSQNGSPGAAEHARIAVTKAIKAALACIDHEHPRLGAHLRATVRCGRTCIYRPDPQRPPRWEG